MYTFISVESDAKYCRRMNFAGEEFLVVPLCHLTLNLAADGTCRLYRDILIKNKTNQNKLTLTLILLSFLNHNLG